MKQNKFEFKFNINQSLSYLNEDIAKCRNKKYNATKIEVYILNSV